MVETLVYYTLKQACALLRVSRYRLLSLIDREQISAVKQKKRWVICRKSVDDLVQLHKTAIETISADIVDLYDKGAGLDYLDTLYRKTLQDLEIAYKYNKGFVERTVYDHFMKNKRKASMKRVEM